MCEMGRTLTKTTCKRSLHPSYIMLTLAVVIHRFVQLCFAMMCAFK